MEPSRSAWDADWLAAGQRWAPLAVSAGTKVPAGRDVHPCQRLPAARPYDILKEGTIAALVVLMLTFGLASLLSSPDSPPVTVRSWVQVAPDDFLATAANELNGTSLTASYGPPSNGNADGQKILIG